MQTSRSIGFAFDVFRLTRCHLHTHSHVGDCFINSPLVLVGMTSLARLALKPLLALGVGLPAAEQRQLPPAADIALHRLRSE
jgi:hypothetical protein